MTADIIKHISVSHPGIPIKVPAVQGDTGRRILFTVTDMDIPSGSSATIYAKKPSGAEIYNSCAVSQSSSGASVITVDLTSATLEEPGEIPAQIQVVNGEDIVTTFLFLLCVQKNIITDSAIEGTNEFTALEEATAAANQAASAANQAKQDADEATEAANNAASTATTAAGTANSAASAANQAKQDADEATTAANNAASTATTAAGTANSAASAATSAAEAANEAAEAANNAAAGDVSNKTVTFQEAAERANIESGDSLAVAFGKLAKFCADFGDAAFAGIANNLTTNTPGSVLDAQQGKVLADEIDELNTKIGLRSVYVSQTGTYTFQMRPGTLALVITYYGIYPHYCAGNGQITANQLVIQDGENTITSVNGNTVSVYNRYDRNNMAQAIIFFIEPN